MHKETQGEYNKQKEASRRDITELCRRYLSSVLGSVVEVEVEVGLSRGGMLLTSLADIEETSGR